MEPFARIPGRYPDSTRREFVSEAVGNLRQATRCANLGTFTGYRIGLDIGNGNIGWCVLFEDRRVPRFLTAEDIAAHNAALPKNARRTQLPDLANFVPLGTHKFQAREPGEKAEKSFSKIRAETRSRERLLDARQRRRLHVRKALEEAGLLPRLGEKLRGHAYKSDDKLEAFSADKLRVKLLDPNFEAHPHDLGQALLNALTRRGWMKPVGRAGEDEGSKFGDEANKSYREALARYGCETVGQFLERCANDARKDGVRFRKSHRSLAWQKDHKKDRPKDPATAKSYEAFEFLTPTFELIREETRLLRERQKEHVPIRNDDWARIEEAAEFRRPLKAKMPGFCLHFPKDRRCLRALPSFQRFRILEQISHLRDQGGNPIKDESFATVRSLLEAKEKITLAELGRELGVDRLRFDKGDYEGKRTLVGAKTDIALRQALGEAWPRLPIEQRDDWTMRFLRRHWPRNEGEPPPWTEEDEETLEQEAGTAFGPGALVCVDEKAAREFEDKFSSISLKAARIKAECYQKRCNHKEIVEALAKEGAPEPDLALYERLPYYGEVMPDVTVPATGFAPVERTCAEELAHGRAPNPDVHVVMNRIREVVNDIVEMMGGILPTTCVVEVARSALSEDAANEHTQRARARERLREAIVKEIEKVLDGRVPTGPAFDRLVDRWKAAIRQGWRDYDGSRIAPSALVDSAVYQLDHVSPAAFGEFRVNNLFVSRFNQLKGRRLPWQAFGDDPSFRPALLAFATFGLQHRVDLLSKALHPKPPRRSPTGKKKAQLEDGLKRAERELKHLGDFEAPQPDVLRSLERSLADRLESLIADADTAEEAAGRKGVPRPFKAGDQAALFCRFGPDARLPQLEFAARDVANIGWSTKLALRYLVHLGADVSPIHPWAVHALRCMFNVNKKREDLRNHALDAFLIAHFDSRVLRPAFASLRGAYEYESLYDPRVLQGALHGIAGGDELFEELKNNLDRLDRVVGTIATAHRADNRWNPGGAGGGSFGALGGENIYTFRPTFAERKGLTAIAAKAGKAPADGRVMTREELLELLLAEPTNAEGCKLRKKMLEKAKVRYGSKERGKITEISAETALPLSDQLGAFIDAESKFAIVAASPTHERRILSVAEFSSMSAAEREAVFGDGRPVYRRGDTVIGDGKALVVTGLNAEGQLIAYPIDAAVREEKQKERITVPKSGRKPPPMRFASDVLGRRLHRLRKGSGGLEPVPYRLRGE
jgi:hypothetical protein